MRSIYNMERFENEEVFGSSTKTRGFNRCSHTCWSVASFIVSVAALLIAIIALWRINSVQNIKNLPSSSALQGIDRGNKVFNISSQTNMSMTTLQSIQANVDTIQNQSNELIREQTRLEENYTMLKKQLSNLMAMNLSGELSEIKGSISNIMKQMEEAGKMNASEVNAIQLQLEGLQNQTSQLQGNLTSFYQMPWPYNGYVYILTPSPESWQNTRRTCQSYGGDLAVVGIKDYKTRLSIASALNLQEVWLGLNDTEREGNWTWVDGTPVIHNEALWYINQPDDFRGGEDCGELWPNTYRYRLNDDACSNHNKGLCEIPYTSLL